MRSAQKREESRWHTFTQIPLPIELQCASVLNVRLCERERLRGPCVCKSVRVPACERGRENAMRPAGAHAIRRKRACGSPSHTARNDRRLATACGSPATAGDRGMMRPARPHTNREHVRHDDLDQEGVKKKNSLGFSLASRSASGKTRKACARGVRARRRQCLEPSTQRERCWAS